MILSIWRYSHLTLAISSFILLIIASVTGIFLAFEPVINKANNYHVKGFDTTTLAQVVPLLKEKFSGIQEILVDNNDFVIVKYSSAEKGDQQVYVNPISGQVLGAVKKQEPFFQWMTNLHRSLFLKETGRILVGIASFLLILIAISGVLLIVQRQNGWRNFLSTIEKTSWAQYYHAVFGRISLFFILALALSGTYLAVYRFVPPPPKAATKIDEKTIQEEPEINVKDFTFFKQTPLSQLQKLQYPFSDFPEDYYNVQLKDKEVCINQFTSEILAEQPYTQTYRLANFSMRWHIGRSGSVWAIIMAITSGYILFFIISGFAITLKRRRSRTKNKFKAKDAQIVILVGSENGATFKFADAISSQLLKHGKKVFTTDLSNYQAFPNANQLIIMASTYGQGDAPSNAKKFAEKLMVVSQSQPIQFSIVGFGSRTYVQYCQFAHELEALLKNRTWATELLPLVTVNDKSPQDFSDWLTQWSRKTNLPLMMPRKLLTPDTFDLKSVAVAERTSPDEENSFLIRLKSRQLKNAASGDLLAIYPKNDHRERLYSIGKINGDIQLSIKLHEHGLGSGFLNNLNQGDPFNVKLIKNQHFRFPKRAPQVIMISNGTGIAPFLGMIDENKKQIPVHLYCGFRTQASFALYESFINQQIKKGKLSSLQLTLSREGEKEYVSHRLQKDTTLVWEALQSGAIIMICGSLSMQKDVMAVLDNICQTHQNTHSEIFLEKGQILTDCY